MFLYILAVSLFFSCSGDNEKEIPEIPEEPEVPIVVTPAEELLYNQVKKAANSSLTIDGVVNLYTSLVFTFSDKSKVEIKSGHKVVKANLANVSEPIIEKGDKSTWIINGSNTDIPVASATDKNLKLIAVAYCEGYANFYINNGEKIEIECTDVGIIHLFKFEAAHNEGLNEEVKAVIKKDKRTIEIVVPYQYPLNSLVATFGYYGKSIKIGATDQVSGVTKNNFSAPLVYSITTNKKNTVTYTVTARQGSPRIPVIYIETEGKADIKKDDYINMTIKVEDPDKIYTNGTTFTATSRIKGRGNSTWNEPKRPYRIKLDEKASLLGGNSNKDWALLANHLDKTLIRNITAFEISRIAQMSWTPASKSVDLYLNGNYRGVYALTEHVEVAKNKLNMDLVKPTDNEGEALTGGYFLELDFHYDSPHQFKTVVSSLPIMFKDPEAPTTQQKEYVENFFNTADRVLYSNGFKDKYEGYRKFIDVESFINYYIVQELAKNVDGNMRGSCYLAVRRNGKIEQPLVWDFDIAFGNADHITWEQGASSNDWDGWYLKTCAPWYDRFFQDPEFVSALKKRWNELKPQLDQLPAFIRKHAADLDDAQKRNFSSGSNGAGWSITEVKWNTNRVRGSYEAEVDYLVSFVEKRLNWLDQNLKTLY